MGQKDLDTTEQLNNVGANGEVGSIPWSGRSPGGGHGNPLQYPCLEIPMDSGVWWATFHRVMQRQTLLSDLAHKRKTFS